MKALIKKYSDIISYGFFGVCTTLVNILSYYVFAHIISIGVMPSTICAWFSGVLFAYLTNRKWVFHSDAKGSKEIIREIISFFLCRLSTGFIDWACMYIFVDVLNWNDMIIKVSANILVIVLNFVASKLIIFKKHRE